VLALGIGIALTFVIGCAGVNPRADQVVRGVAEIWLIAKDGAPYNLSVEFQAGVLPANATATTGVAYLRINARRCPSYKCGAAVAYVQPLAASQYDITDLKRITVHLSSFGKGLTMTWTGAGPQAPVDTTPNLVGTDVDVSSSWATNGKLAGFGITCSDKSATASRRLRVQNRPFAPPFGRPAPYTTGPNLPAKAIRCAQRPKR
jgi:hypothetical protein